MTKKEIINKVIEDLPTSDLLSELSNDEWYGWFEEVFDKAQKLGQKLPIHSVSNWVAVKDALPIVDGFYLVYSTDKQIWTKALYKMSEFHTIESDIDGYITHWKTIVKPPCC